MTITIGSLFAGYGGLDLGVQQAFGPARTAWVVPRQAAYALTMMLPRIEAQK